jgi:hypothetical protein
MRDDKRQRAEEVKKTDKALTDAAQRERAAVEQKLHEQNVALREAWSENRRRALESHRAHRQALHDAVAVEDRDLQRVARNRAEDLVSARHAQADAVRRAMHTTVAHQRELVVAEARARSREDARRTEQKHAQLLDDRRRDLDATREQRDRERSVRASVAAAVRAKLAAQRADALAKDAALRQQLAAVRGADEERVRSVSARAREARVAHERRMAEVAARVRDQRATDAQRIRQQVAVETTQAKAARELDVNEFSKRAQEAERAIREAIKRRSASAQTERAERAAALREQMKRTTALRAQSDSARSAARSRQLVEDASAARQRSVHGSATRAALTTTEARHEASELARRTREIRNADLARQRRRAELVAKEEGRALQRAKDLRRIDPADVDRSAHAEWERAKAARDAATEERRALIAARREEERQAQRRLRDAMVADVQRQREGARSDRAQLLATLEARKRRFEAELAQVELAASRKFGTAERAPSTPRAASSTTATTPR